MTRKKQEVGKVPNLRFPGFDGEWETKKLGEIIDFYVTNSFSRENLNYETGTVKNIHYGDIHTKFQTLFDISKERVPFINDSLSIGRISEDNYCKEGDIILADASEDLNDVGKSIEIVNLNNEKLLSGLHTILARPKQKNFYKGFLGYLFLSSTIRLQIQKEAQGSKVLSISSARISNIELSSPTLNEQHKIATFLSLIDERIQCQNKIINQLKTLMIESSERLFAKKIRFKNFDQNDFSDWGTKRLKEIGTFFSGGTPSTSKKHYYNGDIPFIKSGEINSNQTEQFISDKGLKESSAKMVNVDDVLYALYGATSGEVGLSKINGAINQAILCIRTDLNNMFLMHYLKLKKGVITKTYLQGGQGNLSAEIIKNLEIPIPCSKEQAKIADLLFLIENKIETEKQILEQYKNQKAYLLQNLFI
jgi:type I restriction enzyme S subunit